MIKSSSISSPLLIHIGYAKAASTWLQTHLLGNRSLGFELPFERSSVKRRLVEPAPFEFEAESCRQFFHPTLQSTTEYMPVISSENLTGTSRIGDHQRKDTADRLAAVFPHARILLVLREQNSMLLAQYHQYVRRGGAWSLSRFLNPPITDRHQAPYFTWARFEYHHLIAYYQKLFGAENVLVLPLEMLKDIVQFVGRIASFCEMPVDERAIESLPFMERRHASSSNMMISLGRPLNLLMHKPTSFNPHPLLPVSRNSKMFVRWRTKIDAQLPTFLKDMFEERAKSIIVSTVGDHFAQSNQMTCELTGLNLNAYGYSTKAAS